MIIIFYFISRVIAKWENAETKERSMEDEKIHYDEE